MSARRSLPTLRQVLSNVHFRVTLFAAGITGIAVLLNGFATISFYANQNLRLVANTASYAVAPAVVFGDRHAIDMSIAPISRIDGVGQILISDAQRRTLIARQHAPCRADALGLDAAMTRLLFNTPATSPIVYHDRRIGMVTVYGEASPVMGYIASGLVAAIACLVITAIATHFLADRLMQIVVRPLAAIERVAHAVRTERAFDMRVPAAAIAEIDNLGDDINALLGELEDWQHGLRRENADLSHRALHDPLTGLANRTHFERTLEAMIENARREDRTFAVLYLDGDRFKAVNDAHGHAAGDAVLKEIAARLRNCTRSGDLVARLGGDEFAILLPPDSVAAAVKEIDSRIAAALESPMTLPSGERVTVALSTGFALFPRDGGDMRSLVHHADRAMYVRKRAGKPAERSSAR